MKCSTMENSGTSLYQSFELFAHTENMPSVTAGTLVRAKKSAGTGFAHSYLRSSLRHSERVKIWNFQFETFNLKVTSFFKRWPQA